MILKWIHSANDHDRDAYNWYELIDASGKLVQEGNDHEILMALVDYVGVEIDFSPVVKR